MNFIVRLKSALITFFGGICCFSYILLLIITIPVYIYRLGLILFIKFYRKDLSEIISGQSVTFLSDYFSERPRSNIVCTSVFDGQFTCEEFKSIVLQRWINARHNSGKGELIYRKFQQYPIKWQGFGFWKSSLKPTSIDNHVQKLFGKDFEISEDQLVDVYEKLLNSPLPREQSPWEIYIVENFKSVQNPSQVSSLVILRFHHILADGFSAFGAISEGLFQTVTAKQIFPIPRRPQPNMLQKILHTLTLPISGFCELSYFMSHAFRQSSWKIPDEKKEWHQIFVKTSPIPIQAIKRIKNSFGVTFTSVILSGLSAAISKMDDNFRRDGRISGNCEDYLLCVSTLPVKSDRETNRLTNSVSAALLDLPINKFRSSCERLKKVNKILERTKMSVVPSLARAYMRVLSLQCYPLIRLLSDNKAVSLTVTNFPGGQTKVECDGRAWIDGDFIMGGFNGDGGVVITVLSVNQQIRVGITAERGLMSRKEAKQMASYITDEIQVLMDFIEC